MDNDDIGMETSVDNDEHTGSSMLANMIGILIMCIMVVTMFSLVSNEFKNKIDSISSLLQEQETSDTNSFTGSY
jgi:hypothetical protein